MPAGITPPLVPTTAPLTVPIRAALPGEGHVRADPLDLGTNMSPHSAGHRAGASLAAAVRRQDARSADRSGPGSSAGAGPVRSGCGPGAGDPESDLAGRHAEDRKFEIHDAANNSPADISGLGDLPIRCERRDDLLARRRQVRDGYPPQTNIVHVDGGRSVLLTVEKTAPPRRSHHLRASRRKWRSSRRFCRRRWWSLQSVTVGVRDRSNQ